MIEYQTILTYYGERRTTRSGVRLMNHIDEGLVVLDEIQASELAKRAYCLHPLVQEDAALVSNMHLLHSTTPEAVALAMEYRWVANNYLSFHNSRAAQEIELSPLADVNDMLRADKVQNYKDFLIYHLASHPQAARLDQYFRQWLERLRISKEQFQELGSLLKEISGHLQ